jgi:uncharacterized protein
MTPPQSTKLFGSLTLFYLGFGLSLSGAESALFDAVKSGDPAAVKRVLSQNSTPEVVNARQPDQSTALGWSVHAGSKQVVEMLIAAGADVNLADENGDSPLSLACQQGNLDLAKLLLAKGADVQKARWNGETPLLSAVNSGSLPLVELLLERGANPNVKENREGQTALHWAAAELRRSCWRLAVVTKRQCRSCSTRGPRST